VIRLPRFWTQLWTALHDKHFPAWTGTFLYGYPLHWVIWPTRTHNKTLRYYTPQARSPFWLLKQTSGHAHTRLPPRLFYCKIIVNTKKKSPSQCPSDPLQHSLINILSYYSGLPATTLRLSWSWTVLLPSDTHRKPVTSITAGLLPFVICLLTLVRISLPVTNLKGPKISFDNFILYVLSAWNKFY
jgi:hypothetical protein